MPNATTGAVLDSEDLFDLDLQIDSVEVESSWVGLRTTGGPGSIFERCVESGCCK
ncbi:hypothetical protein Sme01_19390 [Sphaerisporangium melleum]|uniref:Uncharacterized protein n=1 Tax=Sphaerisporangium melleum TaxID=321316 RepID=A0A917RDW9_9ACTN|nr:hypothetical protein [Sphaerisporangium melleum]GGL02917.1 hypothetical protein GCM10007964_51250 [Sphaerisporangium melleum]GII69463.1 hypothetical protein Sme01_19390 [Sphaerisporangium melleum]